MVTTVKKPPLIPVLACVETENLISGSEFFETANNIADASHILL